jgi:hypothetical protein
MVMTCLVLVTSYLVLMTLYSVGHLFSGDDYPVQCWSPCTCILVKITLFCVGQLLPGHDNHVQCLSTLSVVDDHEHWHI